MSLYFKCPQKRITKTRHWCSKRSAGTSLGNKHWQTRLFISVFLNKIVLNKITRLTFNPDQKHQKVVNVKVIAMLGLLTTQWCLTVFWKCCSWSWKLWSSFNQLQAHKHAMSMSRKSFPSKRILLAVKKAQEVWSETRESLTLSSDGIWTIKGLKGLKIQNSC